MTTVAFPAWASNGIRWRVEADVVAPHLCEFYLARLESGAWSRCDQYGHALRSAPALLKAHVEPDSPQSAKTVSKVVEQAHAIADGCARSDDADLNRTVEFIRAEGEWAEMVYRTHRQTDDDPPLVVRQAAPDAVKMG